MITNKEKLIQTIADFLSEYINNCPLNDFFIKDATNLDLTIKVCELARRKCGANVYLIWRDNEENQYEFAKHIGGNAHEDECLTISGMCRTEGIIQRSFYKYDLSKQADIYPFLDLYLSEINQLQGYNSRNYNPLYGTHEELERIDREDVKNGIISSDESPMKNFEWFKYTKPQRELIAKMHAREKKTRHKDLVSRGAVYPSLRDTGYVR